ncbi:pyridine nucleotide-disulfide oxidoreductase domain-containing protein 2 [Anabrus simplex]|uniref:pyridine nucleotide-disulfide oxidoreductase domain-containing protein 2 n=1 Tax=Anabrus simplex TaxID=316456 RepID=UPI0035A285BE
MKYLRSDVLSAACRCSHDFARHLSCYTRLAEPKGKYDAVIVGGGHNGLVSAAYLQRAGINVCVLEKRPVVGGAAVTEEIVPGFKFSRASYVLSLLQPHIIADLELKKYGLKVYIREPTSYTPMRSCKSGGPKSLTLGRNEHLNASQIAQFSQKDAQAYFHYEAQLGRLANVINKMLDLPPSDLLTFFEAPSVWRRITSAAQSRPLREAAQSLLSLGPELPALYEFLTAPAARILSRWFESEPLKATLATDSVIGFMASPDMAGTGYVLLHHVMGELEGIKGAWGYPEGGMGAVTQAMAASACAHGAHIFTDTEVSQIECNSSGQAIGVVTSDGHLIKADVVLSNATPKVTFVDLLPSGLLPETFQTAVQGIDYTSPVTKINVAVDRIPNFMADPCTSEHCIMPHHQSTIHLNCEETGLITDAYKEAQRGCISNRPMIEMVIPSSRDPTIAPPGCHVCLLFTQYTPYHLAGGKAWDDEAKEQYANKVFDNIEEYAPGFKSSIIGKEVLTPPDLERIFGLTGGNIFHGAMSPDQLFLCRPTSVGPTAPLTPVPRLLLCGSGMHPGGGVMGTPGHIAARIALKTLGLARKI